MSAFDFMGFGYDGGHDEMFVAHAKKYSAEETVEICKREFDYLFQDHRGAHGRKIEGLREPTQADVQDAHCAFRMGVMPEFPSGCYTIVGPQERGAFPVRVIDFSRLK